MVLIVVAEPVCRDLVGQVLDALDLNHVDVARWRDAVALVDVPDRDVVQRAWYPS